MPELPTGIVTFFMSDIEGSTRLWEQDEPGMKQVMARHDALASDCIAEHQGHVIKTRGEGDSVFAVFASAVDAAVCACEFQRRLQSEAWPLPAPLRARIALNVGEADFRDGDYFGRCINRCARIRGVAHGGQIVLSQAALALLGSSLPDGLTPRDLGQHRLKDLEEPEWIFQLLHPDLPSEFPPLNSLEAFSHNLPIQLTSFIGREALIAEVRRLLATSRLLTLTGSGGSGKSRLALQAAAEVVEAYSEGVWWVGLASLADPELIPKAVAQALRVSEEPGRPLLETLTDYLKTKSALLILDNCEHLATGCARFVNTLLRACPNLRILATSRKTLRVADEQRFPVRGLIPPDPDNLPPLDDFLQNESVCLWMERAQRAEPAFTVRHREDASSVAQVCRRLEGIPLAIELAAARVTVLSVQEIEENLDRLIGNPLQGLMEWSHDLLDEAQQTLFRRLSVFVGGWTLTAATMVCADSGVDKLDVVDILEQLIHTSLVFAEDQGSGKRYRMLETVRQYAAKKLQTAGETELIRDRHLTYFLGLAETCEPKLKGRELAACLRQLETESDNLRAALKQSVNDERGMRLAGALWKFWYLRGDFAEGRRHLADFSEIEGMTSVGARAKVLKGLGVHLTRQGEHELAYSSLQASLKIYIEIGDESGIAEAMNYVGVLMNDCGKYAEAQENLERSLTIWTKLGDKGGISMALNNLGMAARAQGDFAQARTYYEQDLQLDREIGDPVNIGISLCNLGDIATQEGSYHLAQALFEESLLIFRELGNEFC